MTSPYDNFLHQLNSTKARTKMLLHIQVDCTADGLFARLLDRFNSMLQTRSDDDLSDVIKIATEQLKIIEKAFKSLLPEIENVAMNVQLDRVGFETKSKDEVKEVVDEKEDQVKEKLSTSCQLKVDETTNLGCPNEPVIEEIVFPVKNIKPVTRSPSPAETFGRRTSRQRTKVSYVESDDTVDALMISESPKPLRPPSLGKRKRTESPTPKVVSSSKKSSPPLMVSLNSVCKAPPTIIPPKTDYNAHHKCPRCDRHFIRKTDLDRHLQYHHNDKPFACNICLRAFALESDLTKHIAAHNGGPIGSPFQC